jgi:hypothetical protein
VQLNGESTYQVTDRFSPTINEAFYGLGQPQNGMFNYRGATVELGQNNTDVAIPFLVSEGHSPIDSVTQLLVTDRHWPCDTLSPEVNTEINPGSKEGEVKKEVDQASGSAELPSRLTASSGAKSKTVPARPTTLESGEPANSSGLPALWCSVLCCAP